MGKFRVGDIVRCVASYGGRNAPRFGYLYEVKSVKQEGSTQWVGVKCHGPVYSLSPPYAPMEDVASGERPFWDGDMCFEPADLNPPDRIYR